MNIDTYLRTVSMNPPEMRAAGPFTSAQVRELCREQPHAGLAAMIDLRNIGCPDFIFERQLQRRAAKLREFVVASTQDFRTDADRRAFAARTATAIANDPSDDDDEEYSGKTVNGINERPCSRCGFPRVKKIAPCQDYCSRCGSADPYRKRS